MRPLPVDLKDIAALGIACTLPFVPVALLVVPLDVILSSLKDLFV
jgi:hypothetical protein